MSASRIITVALCVLGVVAALSRKSGDACLGVDAPDWFGSRTEVLEQVGEIDGEKYTFAVLGDIQQGLETFQGALHRVRSDPGVRFAVGCGDLVNNETAPHYRLLLAAAASPGSRLPMLTVPGNHDDPENYRRFIGPTTWSVRLGPDLLVGVDNAWSVLDERELARLETLLAEDGIRHRFVFLHRPVLTGKGVRPGFAPTLAMLERVGVSAVFAGHSHTYDRRIRHGVLHLTNGLGGDISHDDNGLAFMTLVHVGPGGFADRQIPIEKHSELISRVRDTFVAHFYASFSEIGLWSPLLAIALALALVAGFRAWGERAWLPVVVVFAAGFAPPPGGVVLGAGVGVLLLAGILINSSGRFAAAGWWTAMFAVLLLARSPWLAAAALLPAAASQIRPAAFLRAPQLAFSNRGLILAAVVIAIWATPYGSTGGAGWAIALLACTPAWAGLGKMRQSPE